MLSFLSFKSKEFISLISLYSVQSKSKRCLSQLQTTINKSDIYIEYIVHQRLHREERELNRILPAIITDDGRSRYWYKNGRYYRDRDENGRLLPAVIWNDGTQEWWKNGQIHRDDTDDNGRVLPAVIYWDGSQYWCINGDEIKNEKN